MRISRLQNLAAVLALALASQSCVFTLGVWGQRPWRIIPEPKPEQHNYTVEAVASNSDAEARPVQLALRVPGVGSGGPWLVLEPDWQTAAMAHCLERLRQGDRLTGRVGVSFDFFSAPSGRNLHGRILLPGGAPSPLTEGVYLAFFESVPCRARFQADPPSATVVWPQVCIEVNWEDYSHVGTTALRVVLTPVAVVADVVTFPIILLLWGVGALDQQAKKTFGD